MHEYVKSQQCVKYNIITAGEFMADLILWVLIDQDKETLTINETFPFILIYLHCKCAFQELWTVFKIVFKVWVPTINPINNIINTID